ncbi:MAG: glycosyltransferase, partial [Gammaproteobacteria bacterium]|nr:glycosyltransferase [Gammaproteobacteria bacterium]
MISVVIPTYKRSDLLARLLDSIILQTVAPEELVVVDDASPNPEEYTLVINEYKNKIKNLKYIRYEKNRGAPHARNVGIQETKNDWIALVDDDD